MEKIAKVLIIDNDDQFAKNCEDRIRSYAEAYSCSLTHFRKNFEKVLRNQNYTHIIIDGTADIVKIIRRTFTGPLIASSNNYQLNDTMFKAGCSHKIRKDKILDSLPIIIEFEHQGAPAKKGTKEIKLEFVDLMLEFLNSAKNPSEVEKTRELYEQVLKMVKQRKNAIAVIQMKSIYLPMTELETCPGNTASLLEVYNKMINVYTMIW